MSDYQPIRILYMEDDLGLARLLQKSLQRKGYVVDIAGNGEEGLTMLEAAPYDILLVDHRMPIRGGLDVIRTLAAREALPPTIMITGHGNENLAVEAMKLGAADYIVKDVNMGYLDLLPTVIEQVLHKQQLVRDKRQMLETTQESEERYRRLVELSPDGIGLHVEGKLVFINSAGARMLGAASAEELLGKPVLDVVHPDYRQIAVEKLRRLAGQGDKDDRGQWSEEKFIRLDGTEFDVEVAAFLSTYREKPAVQVIFRDITGRKQAEEEREKLILELQDALAKVKTLSGLLPICASCKKIRDDKGYWNQIEVYIRDHSEAEFSHGLCPDCAKKYFPELNEYG
jgi:PAS domain S-box-containing protein